MLGSAVLSRIFYERDTGEVAKNLLGKIIVRRIRNTIMAGIIVETEAYYGLNDPASRAFKGKKKYNTNMWSDCGRAFIFNVHKYWMLNIVSHKINEIGAVLIRALEPIEGIEIMKDNRKIKDIFKLANGPGKLTLALMIDKSFNGLPVTSSRSTLFVKNSSISLDIGKSQRIGVKEDLPRELRYFLKKNRFLSR